MKNKFILLSLVLLMSSNLFAAQMKGQRLYLKKLKGSCHMSGDKMAAKHTRSEWFKIMKSELLAEEISRICPSVPEKYLNEKYLLHYYNFFSKYASDSGNVPTCN